MKKNIKVVRGLAAGAGAVIVAMACVQEVKADSSVIDRYKTDFYYQNIGYQILSEADKTVAVAQDYDIDSACKPKALPEATYVRDDVGTNGFLMSNGLSGQCVVIPQTVYDDNGTAYTVTDLADDAINWVGIWNLVLPPTLERLNGGICAVNGLTSLYLPEGLKEIEGIRSCDDLKTIRIPWNVEAILDRSLIACGFDFIYLPSAVKTLGDKVLAYCPNLTTAMLSEVEAMGEGCFSGCPEYIWANLPETLKTMGEGCFNGCDKLEIVSLPWSEIKMKGCFNGCRSISRIEVLAVEPYAFPEDCFVDVDRSKCTLSVPVGSEDRYRAADGWKDFQNIAGELPATVGTGVAACPGSDFRAVGGNGSLRIVSPSPVAVEVYTAGGEKVASVKKTGVSEIPVPTGVYVVASPYGSRKVAVM